MDTNMTTERKPCYGCGGMTGKNEIFLTCFRCDGEGYYESDDWQDFGALARCHECLGKGGRTVQTYYCCQECREAHE